MPTAKPAAGISAGNSFLDQIRQHRRDALKSAPDPETRERAPTAAATDLSIGAIMQRRLDMGIGGAGDDDDDEDEEDWEEDSDED